MINREAAHRALDALIDALSAPAERPRVYTTRGPLPPGRSISWTKRHLRGIPGSFGRRGLWQITAEDYDAWMVAESQRAERGPAPIPPDAHAAAERYLRAAGMRRNGAAA